jgi:mono/diheme cytochrome c family protein
MVQPPIPLYVTLGIDIDALHESPSIPLAIPSAARGQRLAKKLELDLSVNDYQSQSPYAVFSRLTSTTFNEAERWEVVAYLWQSNTTQEALQSGRELYSQNCAACHGESGRGDGVFADNIAQAGELSMQTMNGAMAMAMQTPVDFTNPSQILGASPALLQGKILRGGMGTGMPMWGSIFTPEEIWDLVGYLYSFQFEYQGEIQ